MLCPWFLGGLGNSFLPWFWIYLRCKTRKGEQTMADKKNLCAQIDIALHNRVTEENFRGCIFFSNLSWSEWWDSNPRHPAPKAGALPTALIPDIRFFCMIPCEGGKSKFFVTLDMFSQKRMRSWLLHPVGFMKEEPVVSTTSPFYFTGFPCKVK